MTQHNVTDQAEQLTTTAHVPLSERPLVAEDERTVITVPEQSRVEARNEFTPVGESYRQRLFPAIGQFDGDEAGIRLAHFEITSRLGSGGMGAVFKATDLELAREIQDSLAPPATIQRDNVIAYCFQKNLIKFLMQNYVRLKIVLMRKLKPNCN